MPSNPIVRHLTIVLASSAINKDVRTYSEEGAGAGTAERKRCSIKHCLFALGVVVFGKK